MILFTLILIELVLISTLVFFVFKEFYYFVLYKYKYKYKILKMKAKAKYSFEDNVFMTNLSLGVFASSLVAVVTAKGYFVLIYLIVTFISAFAMVNYNYKNKN